MRPVKVKVKVTGVENVHNAYFRNVNFDRPYNNFGYIKDRAIRFACGMEYSTMPDRMA